MNGEEIFNLPRGVRLDSNKSPPSPSEGSSIHFIIPFSNNNCLSVSISSMLEFVVVPFRIHTFKSLQYCSYIRVTSFCHWRFLLFLVSFLAPETVHASYPVLRGYVRVNLCDYGARMAELVLN